MSRSLARAALFALVGVGLLLHWVRQLSGWRPPLASSDPKVVVAFTALLLALGLALWQFGVMVAVRRVRRAAAVPGVAAAVCAVTNVIEDGFGVESAFFLFIAATLVVLLGQFWLAVVVLRATGSWLCGHSGDLGIGAGRLSAAGRTVDALCLGPGGGLGVQDERHRTDHARRVDGPATADTAGYSHRHVAAMPGVINQASVLCCRTHPRLSDGGEGERTMNWPKRHRSRSFAENPLWIRDFIAVA